VLGGFHKLAKQVLLSRIAPFPLVKFIHVQVESLAYFQSCCWDDLSRVGIALAFVEVEARCKCGQPWACFQGESRFFPGFPDSCALRRLATIAAAARRADGFAIRLTILQADSARAVPSNWVV
jgi:hypothetical protein